MATQYSLVYNLVGDEWLGFTVHKCVELNASGFLKPLTTQIELSRPFSLRMHQRNGISRFRRTRKKNLSGVQKFPIRAQNFFSQGYANVAKKLQKSALNDRQPVFDLLTQLLRFNLMQFLTINSELFQL